jgi:hypothetical protein
VALIFPKKKKKTKNPWLHRVASYVYRRLLCAGERERADRKTNNGTGDDGVGNDDTAHWKLREKKKRNKKG